MNVNVSFPYFYFYLIMVQIFNRLRNSLSYYTTCFDHNGSSSGVFSYTSFTIELQRSIHTFLPTYTVHKRLHSFLFTPSMGHCINLTTKLKLLLVYYNLIED
jgi:hypothetical protein